MSPYSPSYLYKNRFNKYYFRCRIPVSIRKKYNLKKEEVRKSLGTGNRTEALRLSRIMWVKLEQSDYMMKDLELEIELYDRLLREGRPLSEELQKLRSKPDFIPSDEEEFFDWLAPFQLKAIFAYDKYITERNQQKKSEQPLPVEDSKHSVSISTTGSSNASALPDNFADQVAKKIQLAGKKKLTAIGLQEAFEKYMAYADRLHDWKDRDKHVVDISIFIDIVDIDKCGNLSIKDLIKYRDVIVNLPLKYDGDKECQGLSYPEMAKLQNKKHASTNTLVNKVGVVKSFLRWCEDSNYIDVNFEKPFRTIKKSKKAKKNRVPYTPDELQRLFNSKQYVQGTHKNAARHWVLLITLFTGARLNEVCQLHKSNVVKDNLSGIWYFDFNDYDKEKSKKTDAGIRFVPVHPQLRKLGFFIYFSSVDDNSRLFPMLKKKDRSYGTTITKFFATYKNKNNCNIEIPEGLMKDFHSFRNTIINAVELQIMQTYFV